MSVILIEAVRLPPAEGVKAILIVQFPPAATDVPQLLLSAKSLAFAPVIPTVLILNVTLLLLVRVTAVRAALEVPTNRFPKETLLVESLTVGIAPVPERPTFWRPMRPLSQMVRMALRTPVPLGLKVTLIVQLALAGIELPQLLL